MSDTLCLFCGATADAGPAADKQHRNVCHLCLRRLGRIWYGGKHDDFTCEPDMPKGHMWYQHHHCTVWLTVSDKVLCTCGRELRAPTGDPMARVNEEIAEILQRIGEVQS